MCVFFLFFVFFVCFFWGGLFTCLYTHTQTHIHKHTHTNTDIHIQKQNKKDIHTYIHTHKNTYISTHKNIYTHTRPHIYTHTQTKNKHTHTHTNTHTQAHKHPFPHLTKYFLTYLDGDAYSYKQEIGRCQTCEEGVGDAAETSVPTHGEDDEKVAADAEHQGDAVGQGHGDHLVQGD